MKNPQAIIYYCPVCKKKVSHILSSALDSDGNKFPAYIHSVENHHSHDVDVELAKICTPSQFE